MSESDQDELAPVIPLFGGDGREADDRPARRHVQAREHTQSRADAEVHEDTETDEEREERGMNVLLKRLRTRALSIKESEGVLRALDMDDAIVAQVIERVIDYGYLDDAALAEQLVHAGTQRKGQGRQAIGQTLAKRGIPRDVADAALDALPDDDAERALEFARTKARSLSGLDRDTAMRRLAGQLARRGYGGGVAFAAARTALDEHTSPRSGVRFQ